MYKGDRIFWATEKKKKEKKKNLAKHIIFLVDPIFFFTIANESHLRYYLSSLICERFQVHLSIDT